VVYGTEEREVLDIYVPNSALEREDNACLLDYCKTYFGY